MSISTPRLIKDILEAQSSDDYNNHFYIAMIEKRVLNPFRVYFLYLDEWWSALAYLEDYPIQRGVSLKEALKLKFEGRIPPCPNHKFSAHPNIYSDGFVCWGETKTISQMKVINILQTSFTLLNNPNHASGVGGHCYLRFFTG